MDRHSLKDLADFMTAIKKAADGRFEATFPIVPHDIVPDGETLDARDF